MPLRLKCPSCRQTLVLEDVFRGAHCRCAHCRTIMPVPAGDAPRPNRPTTRPDAPPLASHTPRAKRPATRPATSAQTFYHRKSFRVIAAALVLGAGALGATVWTLANPSGRDGSASARNGGTAPPSQTDPVDRNLLESRPHPMLAADPLQTYFGVPVKGETVGYVVDCDSSMAIYLDDVAFITRNVTETMRQGGKRFGIVQALARADSEYALEVSEPSLDVVGAWTTLQGSLAGGDTRLAEALAVTEGWYADQIFLVLAKELDDREIALLQQHALQTRAVTHVIALGRAAELNLSAIAGPTGGRYISVDDTVFRALVNNHRLVANKEEQGG